MSTSFLIVPVEPDKWETNTSDLCIDPNALQAELCARWPEATVHIPPSESPYVLNWQFDHKGEPSRTYGLQGNRQVVSFEGWDAYLPEFVLWYRAYIPAHYHLFLTCASYTESDYLELAAATTETDVKAYALRGGPTRAGGDSAFGAG